jgi:hypothetical protein
MVFLFVRMGSMSTPIATGERPCFASKVMWLASQPLLFRISISCITDESTTPIAPLPCYRHDTQQPQHPTCDASMPAPPSRPPPMIIPQRRPTLGCSGARRDAPSTHHARSHPVGATDTIHTREVQRQDARRDAPSTHCPPRRPYHTGRNAWR